MNSQTISPSSPSSVRANYDRSNYNVLVEYPTEGRVTASILGWPECHAEGETKEEALQQLKNVLSEQLRDREIVSLTVELDSPQPQTEHPWLQFAGMFEDNPLFEEVIQDMAAYRKELDTDIEESERKINSEVG
ncbi:MAG: type II toxin-antitoxin system HicB family antitoxin [Cyanobacteria bacterium P01_E01_bin.42]